MRKIRERKGSVSTLEAAAILVIVCGILYFTRIWTSWMKTSMENGNDSLMANTAESIALVNSSNGLNCPVCGNEGHCQHWTSEGYIGYFDNISNTIVGEIPKGYNENTTMEIDGKMYYGDRYTMVLQVKTSEEHLTVSWQKGKNK